MSKVYLTSKHLGAKNKLSKLLEESPEKWYWLGFMMGDGYFSPKGRIKVTLSPKDRHHLQKLVDFCGHGSIYEEGEEGYVRWAVMDVNTVGILKDEYKISNRKTYEPCDLSKLTPHQLKCFSIGFIDADGSIQLQKGRVTTRISIKGHSSWVSNFKTMFGRGYLNNEGYATSCIGNFEIQKMLKRFSIDNNLPILSRKWDIIDLEHDTSNIIFDNLKNDVIVNLNRGLSQADTARILGVSVEKVNYIKWRYL